MSTADCFREELKEHCKRQVARFEKIEKLQAVTPNDWKRYEEHRYVLSMIEKFEQIEEYVFKEHFNEAAYMEIRRIINGDND